MRGIDKAADFNADPFMQTPQNIITVTTNPPRPQPTVQNIDLTKRPRWMVEGSFLVFRKLEQDVQGFINLANKFASAGCANPEHCGAKLMGRWKSGRYRAI